RHVRRQGSALLSDRPQSKFGQIGVKHQVGGADAYLCMQQPAAGLGRPRDFDRVESTLQKVDVVRASLDGQMSRQGAETFGYGIFCFSHSVAMIRHIESGDNSLSSGSSLSRGIFLC